MDAKLTWESKDGVDRANGLGFEYEINEVDAGFDASFYSDGMRDAASATFVFRQAARTWLESHHAAVIKAVEAAKPKWIPVSERLPEPNVICAVSSKEGVTSAFITTSVYHTNRDGHPVWMHWQSRSDGEEVYPTHWMPLPEPPATQKEQGV